MNAIVFPGQGAQYAGMGESLFSEYPQARELLQHIDELVGFALSQKCFRGSSQELRDTSLQQLAIVAISLTAYEIFKTKNIPVQYFAGLSLGEYTCLYAAEVLSLGDVITLVRERSRAMHRASQRNAAVMFAVMGIKEAALKRVGEEEGFYLANYNAPGQIIISLRSEQKEYLKQLLEGEGARVVELQVSGGFHSPFMQEAQQDLSKIIDQCAFHDARMPVVSNVTARPHTKADEIKQNLIAQLTSPVRWKECVEYMRGEGVSVFYEIGPSKILRGLIKKISPQSTIVNIEHSHDFENIS